MTSPERVLLHRIFAEYGAHPDVRLFRNFVGGCWVGKAGPLVDGVVTLRHARFVEAGLCPGSADVIGIGPGGRLVAMELKATRHGTHGQQDLFLAMVRRLGGIGGVVRSVEDAGLLLWP